VEPVVDGTGDVSTAVIPKKKPSNKYYSTRVIITLDTTPSAPHPLARAWKATQWKEEGF
jgi:hypothetical protein